MSGIHHAILTQIKSALQAALIDNIAADDVARAGIVVLGPLQADPSKARISVTLYENDPDAFYSANTSGMSGNWSDNIVLIETGAHTYSRKFTVKARCLLANTKENKEEARQIASTVRERIETALLGMSFSGATSGTEFVSRPVMATSMKGEMIQAGGPPNSYDYHIKIRFDVLTTRSL